MCGPSGCCQAVHGSCCELARLSVPTYMPLFPKEGKKKGGEGKEVDRGYEEGGYNTGME